MKSTKKIRIPSEWLYNTSTEHTILENDNIKNLTISEALCFVPYISDGE